MPTALIAIDQGTTSTRAIVFDGACGRSATAQQELRQIYPAPGEVEHDPEEIWTASVATVREAMAQAAHWRRTMSPASASPTSARPRSSGTAPPASRSTMPSSGRTAAPPTSATRCARAVTSREIAAQDRAAARSLFLRQQDRLAARPRGGRAAAAEAGRLAFGTIDSFLLWRLTGGKVHATDATNAARTLLFDIGRGRWDDDLCRLFGVPERLLPEVRDCAATSARRCPTCSARRSAFSAWPATSRRRPSGRAASSPA